MSQQSTCTSQSLYDKVEKLRQGIRNHSSKLKSFLLASLWVIESVPVIGALASIAIYLLPWPWSWPPARSAWLLLIAVSGGALFAVICWVILSLFAWKFANARHINMDSYLRITDRLCQVAAWIESWRKVQISAQSNPGQPIVGQPNSGCACKDINAIFAIYKKKSEFSVDAIGVQEICTFFCTIYDKLQDECSIAWISGLGYLNVWRLMHRIDEAFVLIEPEEDVIYDALHDLRSIQNSRMADEVTLVSTLVNSVFLLDPCAAQRYLDPSTAQRYLNQSIDQQFTPKQKLVPSSTPQPGCPAPQQALARTMIREARFRLNQFRDDRWEKLIRVRLLMKKMTFWTGLVLYALLVFAILLRTNAVTLGLLAVYYLIGATVGLFGRLYDQSKVDVSLDNYHLADARLLALPLYSGLAAILGISLFGFLPVLSNLGGNTPADSHVLGFASLFVFSPPHVLLASMFGLAPNLFTNAIQAQVDRYTGDIKSTGVQAKKEQ